MDLKTIFVFLAVMIGLSFFRRMARKRQLDGQKKLAAEKKIQGGDKDIAEEDNQSEDEYEEEEDEDNYWDEEGNIKEDKEVKPRSVENTSQPVGITIEKFSTPETKNATDTVKQTSVPKKITTVESTTEIPIDTSNVSPVTLNLNTLRQAVILSEIIGKPVSLRDEETE